MHILPAINPAIVPAITETGDGLVGLLGGKAMLAIEVDGIPYAIALEIEETTYAIAI